MQVRLPMAVLAGGQEVLGFRVVGIFYPTINLLCGRANMRFMYVCICTYREHARPAEHAAAPGLGMDAFWESQKGEDRDADTHARETAYSSCIVRRGSVVDNLGSR